MEPIRILHVVTKMDAAGIETLLMNFYRNIDREKIQFDFLLHRDEKGFYDDEIIKLGGRLFRVPPINPFNHKFYIESLENFFEKHGEYTIVHSHLNTYSMYVLRAAKKFNVPIRIAHSHICSVPIDFKTPFRIYSKYGLKKYANYLFACSEDAAKWLFGSNAKNAKIIKNSIDIVKYIHDETYERDIRSKFQLQNDLIVAHVGRFTRQKNHEKILEVFKEITQIIPNAKLLLIGKGELEKEISNKINTLGIEDKVNILGEIENVNDILQIVDVFLFPSIFEGLGISAIESQAAGIKTFVSENIPQEAFITDDIIKINLTQPSVEWAEIITSEIPYKKVDNYAKIANAGYDVRRESKKLEAFYLNVSNI